MISAAILFPKGSAFFNVEGVPVVLTRPPGKIPFATAYDREKPPRPFPFESVMRNGAPITEAKFRAYAGLPMRPAQLELVGDDGIPILEDDDPAAWDTAAAADAARLAAAAIARAARH